MFGLIYLSQATREFDNHHLLALSEQAATKNRQLAVTGFLVYRNNYFIQYLEGKQQDVQLLMDAIERDARHSMIRIISLPEQGVRQFRRWSMLFVDANQHQRPNLIDLLENILRELDTASFQEEYLQNKLSRFIPLISSHFIN